MQRDEKTLQQMIREYEAQIPPDIMNIINSFDWKKEVRIIINQNQLLLDVGSDLEESVYLMILGIVDMEQVFKRMMEIHELPEDKVQKVLIEVEKQIFEPMYSELSKLQPSDEKTKEEPFLTPEPEPESYVPSRPSPFSIGKTDTNSVEQKPSPVENVSEQIDIDDPVSSTLNQPTVAEPQIVQPQNQNKPKQNNYSIDPYREPIE